MYFNIRYDKDTLRTLSKDILSAVEVVDGTIKFISPAKLKMFAELLSEADSCEVVKFERKDE